ncbi:MAG: O-antigen ligase family protein [Oscillospiraceae bacterium]|nr:O-antigen ligase family protein [Oscillospiraceae bacterium]
MKMLKLKPNIDSLSMRITEIYIFLMLFLFPLFTGFKGYVEVTLSKYVFFVAVTALWLIALFITELVKKASNASAKLTITGIFILFYLFFCCISAVFSSYKASVFLGEGRFDGLITIIFCVGIFFGISQFARPKCSYIYLATAAVSLNCIVAVLQILGYNPLHLFPGDYNFYDAGVHFSSTFLGTIGNADLFSAYLCLMLPLTSVYYICAEKRPLSLLPCVLLTAYCLFMCGVSGGILAIAVTAITAAPFVITNGERLRRGLEIALVILVSAFFVFAVKITETANGVNVYFLLSKISTLMLIIAVIVAVLRLAAENKEFRKQPLHLIFTALAAVLVIIGFLTAYYWKGTDGSVYELSQLLHGNAQDSFGSSRILIWRKTLELVPERLLLGGGPGTLALRLDVNFSRIVEETGKTLSSSVDNAHNDYLGILVNTGLISLVAYLAAQLLSLFKASKAAKRSEFCACLACALLCYWVQAFFGLGLFLVSPIMWLMWGFLVSSLRRDKTDTPIV